MDKPVGPTSHDVVARVRRVLGQRSVGHAGTLDPFASGLLVVLSGRATRLARFVERERKVYLAEARLGVTTDTDDRTGAVVREVTPAVWPTRAAVEEAMAGVRGATLQRPPAFSAKRVAGRRSYALARRGTPVELAPVAVEVHALELVRWDAPILAFRATVSAGTYIRALARDIGERLEVGAHCTALRRERIGGWSVADAQAPDALTRESPHLAPLDLVPGLPRQELTDADLVAVRHGRAVPAERAAGWVALVTAGRLVAVAEGTDAGWQPRVVLEAA